MFLLRLIAVVEFLKAGLVCLLRFSKVTANECREKAVDPFVMSIIKLYIITLDFHSESIE